MQNGTTQDDRAITVDDDPRAAAQMRQALLDQDVLTLGPLVYEARLRAQIALAWALGWGGIARHGTISTLPPLEVAARVLFATAVAYAVVCAGLAAQAAVRLWTARRAVRHEAARWRAAEDRALAWAYDRALRMLRHDAADPTADLAAVERLYAAQDTDALRQCGRLPCGAAAPPHVRAESGAAACEGRMGHMRPGDCHTVTLPGGRRLGWGGMNGAEYDAHTAYRAAEARAEAVAMLDPEARRQHDLDVIARNVVKREAPL